MNLRPLIIFSVLVVGAMLVASAWAWTRLPADAQVPIHWNAAGQADGWADKTVGLFLFPVIAAGVAVLFVLIPRYDPRRANIARSASAYRAIWIGVMLLFAGMQGLAIAAALGSTIDMTRLVFTAVGVLFVVIGNYLPKVRPNYMVGIRTPWTLASDLAWTKTHRIGGRLFVIEGLVLMAIGLLGVTGPTLVGALIGGIVVLLVVVFTYSYQVWKVDPEKRVP